MTGELADNEEYISWENGNGDTQPKARMSQTKTVSKSLTSRLVCTTEVEPRTQSFREVVVLPIKNKKNIYVYTITCYLFRWHFAY